MTPEIVALGVLAGVLVLDTLRKIYAVGRTWNDHAVAAVVLGCFAFYLGLAVIGPGWVPVVSAMGVVGLWGLFFALHRDGAPPAPVVVLATFSQLAYAFALWGGLFSLLRLPWAVFTELELTRAAGLWSGLTLWPGLALIPALILTLLGAWETHRHGAAGRVTRHRVAGLPLRLVQLSDLHASPITHSRTLDAVIDATNTLSPDLVVITGDLLMPFSEQEHGYLLRALDRLSCPWYACAGNHDLPVLATLEAELQGRLLVDRRARVGAVEVVGVGFHWRRAQQAFRQALDALPREPGTFRVLLAHDPRLGAWVQPGDAELVLSGHTHGGQVAANMLGLPISVLRPLGVRDQGWFPGPHYVHAGNWVLGLPPRMGVGPEIALFEPG